MAELVEGPVRVRVPASSANLGPGFDCLGLALRLHDVLTAEVVDGAAGEPAITVTGEGAGAVPDDESHLVHRAMAQGFAVMGIRTPAVRLACDNAIPHGRGLGSSSAAIVGGLVLARELVVGGRRLLDDQTLFRLAADLEGHPDNVAATFYGALTVSYGEPGDFHAVRLEVDGSIAFVVFIPQDSVLTTVARGLLPATVPHADAVRTAGRAALLVAALTGRPDQLMAATEDLLHQPYRAAAMPGSAALVADLRAAGLPAVVSGAGPTVLALVRRDQVADALRRAPQGWRATELRVDAEGARREV